MMNFTDLELDDSPLTRMALAVMAANAMWFLGWGWAMDSYQLGMNAWAWPQIKGSPDA
jgi:hypothetical protein